MTVDSITPPLHLLSLLHQKLLCLQQRSVSTVIHFVPPSPDDSDVMPLPVMVALCRKSDFISFRTSSLESH